MKSFVFSLCCLLALMAKAQAPAISNFVPTSGPVGTLVTISGTNLSNPTSVTIGGVAAVSVRNTSSTLVAMVMPGATTGSVAISTPSGSATQATYSVTASRVPSVQQGLKLVGSNAIGPIRPQQGTSVKLSADGNTALIGGRFDDNGIGAAWVFVRTGTTWTEQAKLVGSGSIQTLPIRVEQGSSVDLSADGNTAIIGGYGDDGATGAAWVFTRSGTVWTQQGNKLIGTGAATKAQQGRSVSLSADGNTALVGGNTDNNGIGAVWVFTRSAGIWSQQGQKLVGTGIAQDPFGAPGQPGPSNQGVAVSLSADGNTALVGADGDSSGVGATWVFVRNTAGVWSQQGPKQVGIGVQIVPGQIFKCFQGTEVHLSADGNTAIVSGHHDNDSRGAAWVFTRTGSVWTQQGPKLVMPGTFLFGLESALSGDGNIALIGASGADMSNGEAWTFTRSAGVWSQSGPRLVGTGAIGAAWQGSSVSLSADGNTALVAGPDDDGISGSAQGAVWVFVGDATTAAEPDAKTDEQGGLRLYPNPVKRSQPLSLALPDRNANSDVTIEMIDPSGRVLQQQRAQLAAGHSEAIVLSVANLAAGHYTVRFTAGSVSTTGRVLVID